MKIANRWLEKFKRGVIPQLIREFQPEKLVLFGSRIKGGADEDSDIDVMIVSNAFTGIPFVKRMPLILKKIRFNKHVDFICYSPTEFQKVKNTSSVVMDALQHGELLIT